MQDRRKSRTFLAARLDPISPLGAATSPLRAARVLEDDSDSSGDEEFEGRAVAPPLYDPRPTARSQMPNRRHLYFEPSSLVATYTLVGDVSRQETPQFVYFPKPLQLREDAPPETLLNCVGVRVPDPATAPKIHENVISGMNNAERSEIDAQEATFFYDVSLRQTQEMEMSKTMGMSCFHEDRKTSDGDRVRGPLIVDLGMPPWNGLPQPFTDPTKMYELHQQYVKVLLMKSDEGPGGRGDKFEAFVSAFRSLAVPRAKALVDAVLAQGKTEKSSCSGVAYDDGIVFKVKYAKPEYRSIIKNPETRNKFASLELKGTRYFSGICMNVNDEVIIAPFHMVVSYKGVGVLCTPLMPVMNGFQCHGVASKDSVLNSDPTFSRSVQSSAAALKLDSHEVIPSNPEIILPFDAQGFRSDLDNRLYVLHLARMLPPTYPRYKNKHNEYLYEILRPEFMRMLPVDSVVVDACSTLGRREWKKPLRQVTRTLLQNVVPSAAKDFVKDFKLETVHTGDVRGTILVNYLHNNGINIRYLHVFLRELEKLKPRCATTLGAIDIVRTEMVVRAMKRLLNAILQGRGTGADTTVVGFLKRTMDPVSARILWGETIYPMLASMYEEFSLLEESQGYEVFDFFDVDRVQIVCRVCAVCGVELMEGGIMMSTTFALQALDVVSYRVNPISKHNRLPDSPYPLEGEHAFHVTRCKGFIRKIVTNSITSLSVLRLGRHCNDYLRNTFEPKCEELEIWSEYITNRIAAEKVSPWEQLKISKSYLFKYRALRVRATFNKPAKTAQVSFDVSTEACQVYGFFVGQRVIHTNEAKRDMAATIIGVGTKDGLLYIHNDDEMGATPCIAREKIELMIETGFVLFMTIRLLDLDEFVGSNRQKYRPNKPFLYLGPNGVPMMLETTTSAMEWFGFQNGDCVMFTKGESRGKTCVILGIMDSKLWYHPDVDGFPRFFEERDVSVIHEKFGPVVLYSQPKMLPYALQGMIHYGLTETVTGSHKACSAFGFFYRQRLCMAAGEMVGVVVTVLGVRGSLLSVILEHNNVVMELQECYTRAAIIARHKPEVIGLATHPPEPLPLSPRFTYTGKQGRVAKFDARCSTCVLFGAVHKQRVKITQGQHVNKVGTVVGVLNKQLHVTFTLDAGTVGGTAGVMMMMTVPVDPGSFKLLNASIKDVKLESGAVENWNIIKTHVKLRRALFDVPAIALNPFAHISYLAEFGEVLSFDIQPMESKRFNMFHGQRVMMLNGSHATILGVCQSELWCVYDGEAFARPMPGGCFSAFRARFRPTVVGMAKLTPFHDPLMVPDTIITLTTVDATFEKPNVLAFLTETYGVVGFDTTAAHIAKFHPDAHQGLRVQRHDTVTVREKKSVGYEQTVVGPYGTVIGVFMKSLWIQFDGKHHATQVPQGQLERWKIPTKHAEESKLKAAHVFVAPPVLRFYVDRLMPSRTPQNCGFLWYSDFSPKKPFHLDDNAAIENYRIATTQRVMTSGTVLLSDGSRVSLSQSKHVVGKVAYNLTPVPLFDMEAQVATMIPFSVKNISPGLLEAHSTMLTKKWEVTRRRPPLMFVSQYTHGLPVHVYTMEDLPLMTDAFKHVMQFVSRDLVKRARDRGSSPHGREVRARLQLFPTAQYGVLLKHMLASVFVVVDERGREDVNLLSEIVAVLEEDCACPMDCVLVEEWCCHLTAEMQRVVAEEPNERNEIIIPEEDKDWQVLVATYEKAYRKNAGVVIFNQQGNVLACERIDVKGALQFPQGGVEDGEDFETAAVREMYEELGVRKDDVTFLGAVPGNELLYEFPPKETYWRGKGFLGQSQMYFLAFVSSSQEAELFSRIDLAGKNGEHAEFASVTWRSWEEVLATVPPFKASVFTELRARCVPIIARHALRNVWSSLDRQEMRMTRVDAEADQQWYGNEYVQHSIFADGVGAAAQPLWGALIARDIHADRAVGALCGLVIGDAVGHPLEFMAADGIAYDPEKPWTRPGLVFEPDGAITYREDYNKFRLLPGQWTDDASMALCLADSLLVVPSYHGGDCRARYHFWWHHGYNNAFRFDTRKRTSCGLGGNISKSLDELMASAELPMYQVPEVFNSTGEDAGNGSIMRLAPVPIRFWSSAVQGHDCAVKQSRATHPGNDAAACCAFITFVVSRAISRSSDVTLQTFLDDAIDAFLAAQTPSSDSGIDKLALLLRCKCPGNTEAVWDWRQKDLKIAETLAARGRSYNGYPVSAGYFGAYCMDGLAMALWGLHRSTSYADVIFNVVNLMGDADTTGAIAGQMAGAFYGYAAMAAGKYSSTMVANMYQWDRHREIPLRASLLYLTGEFLKTPDAATMCKLGNGEHALRRFDRAAEYYSLGVRQEGINDGTKASFLVNRVACLMMLRRWEEAVAECNVVIEMDPSNVMAQYRRAVSYAEMGRKAEAAEDLKTLDAMKSSPMTAASSFARIDLEYIRQLIGKE